MGPVAAPQAQLVPRHKGGVQRDVHDVLPRKQTAGTQSHGGLVQMIFLFELGDI